MSPHTKGPLATQLNSGGGQNIGFYHRAKGGSVFVRLGYSAAVRNPLSLKGAEPIEEAEAVANARLWATSPQLLEALKLMLDEAERWDVAGDREADLVLLAARAAVAKAEGRDPLAAVAKQEA